jgi:hypothetical protein
VTYLTAFGIYAAQCTDCREGLSETRGESLYLTAIFFGLLLLVTLLGIWLGARFSGSLGRVLGAARDVRDVWRGRRGHENA